MDPDDAADVVENLSEPEVAQILVRMNPDEADEIRRLSDFAPDSAGGIMTPEFVAVSADATADEAIAAIRSLVGEAETVDYVYVVDPDRHLSACSRSTA
jgi:magnesium transporter